MAVSEYRIAMSQSIAAVGFALAQSKEVSVSISRRNLVMGTLGVVVAAELANSIAAPKAFAADENSLILTTEGLGKLAVGGEVRDDVAKSVGLYYDEDAYGKGLGAWVTSFTGEIRPYSIVLSEDPRFGRLESISVSGGNIFTEAGITVGSSEEELRAAYGKFETEQHESWFTQYTVLGKTGSLEFLVAAKDPQSEEYIAGRIFNIRAIANDTKVASGALFYQYTD